MNIAGVQKHADGGCWGRKASSWVWRGAVVSAECFGGAPLETEGRQRRLLFKLTELSGWLTTAVQASNGPLHNYYISADLQILSLFHSLKTQNLPVSNCWSHLIIIIFFSPNSSLYFSPSSCPSTLLSFIFYFSHLSLWCGVFFLFVRLKVI